MFAQLLENKPQASVSSSRISHGLGLFLSMTFTYLCLPTKNSSIVSLQELTHVSEGMLGEHNSLSLTQITDYHIRYSLKVTFYLKSTGFIGLVMGRFERRFETY